jgi:hypothetical protein
VGGIVKSQEGPAAEPLKKKKKLKMLSPFFFSPEIFFF